MQHLQHVGAGYARAKEAIGFNLPDVGDLVADRSNLGDSLLAGALLAFAVLPNETEGVNAQTPAQQ